MCVHQGPVECARHGMCLYLRVYKRIYPGGARAEPLAAAANLSPASFPASFPIESHLQPHFLGSGFGSVAVVCSFYLGKAGPTGCPSLSSSLPPTTCPFSLLTERGLAGCFLSHSVWAAWEQRPQPRGSGSPILDNALWHISHMSYSSFPFHLFSCHLLLPSPGKKHRLPKPNKWA